MTTHTATTTTMATATVSGRLQVKRGSFHLDAAFAFPAQGITALFGPSGAGKSTLLRAIAGLEKARGYLRVDGQDWQTERYALRPYRRPVGYVFQEADLFRHLSVCDNLLFGYRRVPPQERLLAPDDVIDRLGLNNLLERNPMQLSGGERQRVAIGRALLAHPQLLLLDEPLAALDKGSKNAILPYLEQLQEILPVPLLYVSHSHEEVARLADFLLLLDQGRIREQGPLPSLVNRIDSPLISADEYFSLVSCQLDSQLPQHQLSCLRVGNTPFLVPALARRTGSTVRLRVDARDVSVCLNRPTDTSILNIVPMQLQEVGPLHNGQRLLLLSNNDLSLTARVSELSCQRLGLGAGQHLFAQIKSVALLNH